MTDVDITNPHSQLHATSSIQWVEIQKNTFKNWVNEQLKANGLVVEDLRTDFRDGVLLVALLEAVQRRKIPGLIATPTNHHEKLQNITVALDAISRDNVNLVNIDSTHITEGNVKLILALLWQLVLRYQIGLSNIHHKHFLLAWLRAVLPPECNVSNLTTDWNSGIALHALLEFCKPGISPDWRHIKKYDKINNCRDAMKLARQHFGIPLILRPEDLASPELDELSAITYLSYFIKTGAPGYNATLQRIQPLVRSNTVFNFATDWNNGLVLCELVHTLGGNINNWPEVKGTHIDVLQTGMDGGKRLGVEPLLTSQEMAEEQVEHLGIMAYASQFLHKKPSAAVYTNFHDTTKVVVEDYQTSSLNTSTSTLTAHRPDTRTDNTSYNLVRYPSLRKKRKEKDQFSSPNDVKIDTYSVGVIIETTSHTIIHKDDVLMEAESPAGRVIKMSGDGSYNAQFSPDEIGMWTVKMYCDGKLVDSCPIDVCDPSQVIVSGMKGGVVGKPHSFTVDCTTAGEGKMDVDIMHEGRRVPAFVKQSKKGLHKVDYTPYTGGVYKITVNFNRAEIRHGDQTHLGEMQRRAVFHTSITPKGDHFKIKSICDWQIDYLTGGPFEVYVADTSDIRVYSMQDGSICQTPHLIADCTHAPDGKLDAEVTHNGYRFPAEIVEDQPGVYRVSFKPRGTGIYKVWLVYDGNVVKGSPFIQEIDELVSPKAEGDGLKKGQVGQPATFKVDARGFPGTLTIGVEGPKHNVPSDITPDSDGTHRVTYVPKEPGIHRVHVELDGQNISDSPFRPVIVDPNKLRISGGWGSLMDDNKSIPLIVHKEKQIPFDATDAGPGELTANVRGPSDRTPVTVDSPGHGKHVLIFTPREEGKHYIDVFWNDYPLSGTPYHGYANRVPDSELIPEPTVLHIETQFKPPPVSNNVDEAWPKEYSKEPDHFLYHPPTIYTIHPNVVTREPNGRVPDHPLSPHSPKIHVYRQGRPLSNHCPPHSPKMYRRPHSGRSGRSTSPNSSRQGFVPRRSPSSLHSSTTFSEPDVTLTRLPRMVTTYHTSDPSPNSSPPSSRSPSYLYTQPQHLGRSPPTSPGGSSKVVLSGKGIREARAEKPAHFKIDGRKAGSGEPAVKLSSIRTENVPVDVKPIGPKQYRCTYTAKIPGAYLLDIHWNKRPLRGSPYKVNVHNPVFPRQVSVSGYLDRSELGKNLDIQVDPREAGKAELTVDCTGPRGHKLPVNIIDNYDGTFRVKAVPKEEGRHRMDVKYGGDHITGSPFYIDIHTNKPPLGPVHVYGPGTESGVLPDFEGHFWVDARGAGSGELHVSIMGPKGAFQVEMQRTSQKDRLFHCRYDPVEPGVYTINVQWSGVHVDGSPYRVDVATSKEELERMIEKTSSVRSSPRTNTTGEFMY